MLALQQSSFDFQHQTNPASSFLEAVKDFVFNGKQTEQQSWNGIPFFFNEFWTARQRQCHSIHEVSYRACFKPQLPGFFISKLTQPGDTVYDPFMGRGTTIIEAALLGRHAVGNDVNPLSTMLARPRIAPPKLSNIVSRLQSINWKYGGERNEALLAFYHPDTLDEIHALRSYLLERQSGGLLDDTDDWIRMVALNRLTGHSSGFFSVYSLPPNQAVSVEAQLKINAKRSQTPPRRSVPDIILKKSRSLLADGFPELRVKSHFLSNSAEDTGEIGDRTVDLVVTSPPFLDVVQYASDNWLRTWFAGIDAKSVNIAMHRKPENWKEFVRKTFMELSRVVKQGGHVAFEVGEVRNGKIELEKLVLDAISGSDFEPLCVVVNVQEFTKTANCWGVSNNSKGTNSNRIVVVRRR